jgi:hypothetical protein
MMRLSRTLARPNVLRTAQPQRGYVVASQTQRAQEATVSIWEKMSLRRAEEKKPSRLLWTKAGKTRRGERGGVWMRRATRLAGLVLVWFSLPPSPSLSPALSSTTAAIPKPRTLLTCRTLARTRATPSLTTSECTRSVRRASGCALDVRANVAVTATRPPPVGLAAECHADFAGSMPLSCEYEYEEQMAGDRCKQHARQESLRQSSEVT